MAKYDINNCGGGGFDNADGSRFDPSLISIQAVDENDALEKLHKEYLPDYDISDVFNNFEAIE
jgi:hypothetical protein